MAVAEKEEGAADWSNLPYDLLEETLDQLVKDNVDVSSDYARWAAVCISWRQVYNNHEPLIHHQLPVLMIPSNSNTPPSNEDDSDQFHSFYKITDGKAYDQLKFTMPSYRKCRGSSHGWIVAVDDEIDKGFPVRLINPFLSSSDNNNNEISLPSLKHLPIDDDDDDDDDDEDDYYPRNYNYLHKAILSADPLSIHEEYIVMAIYGGERFKRLAYWRPGDQVWVPIGPKRIKFEDVIVVSKSDEDFNYYKYEFVAVTSMGTPYWFKVGDILNESVADVFANPQTPYRGFRFRELPLIPNKKLYLVPILERRAYLLVLRVIDVGKEDETTKTRPYSTKEFKVFKISSKKDERGKTSFGWEETKALWGHTLFIGDNASMSICAADCPHVCKPDCIYYTDDCYLGYVKDSAGNGAHDMGLFNVKDNSFEKHYPTDANNPIWPIPIWVEPSIRKAINVLRD